MVFGQPEPTTRSVGLFDRDYMRFPQGPDDAYFEWLNEVGLSSRTFAHSESRVGTAGAGAQIMIWLVASVVLGLVLGAAFFFLTR